MDGIGEEGEGIRLSKRFSDNKPGSSGEVDYKTKAGTAWSHSYLNQKPWHPLSYPNQRRKWIAEQTHAQRMRRADEVAREYAQEQEFFRQTALISKKEKEKVEMMKAVSFMYVRPPGYNAESAKAAEIADERKKIDHNNTSDDQSTDVPSTAMPPESLPGRDEEKKKPRPKDVFGRSLPTEEEFEILKNAPRLETGVPGRVKPFGVEVRNVKCLRCGNYGHQSGDRECPLKDAIMPNEESRLKRDDPLTAIKAQMDPTEPLKWELKQKPGMSPPHGGFQPDDPNQQIVAEDIFDEYGGFLSGGNIPDLLTNISCKPKKRKSSKKSKHKRQSSPSSSRELEVPDEDGLSSTSDDGERKRKKEKKTRKKKKKRQNYSGSNSSDGSEFHRHQRRRRHKHSYSSEVSDSDRQYRTKESREKHSYTSEDSDSDLERWGKKSRSKRSYSSAEDFDRHHRKSKHKCFYSSEDSDSGWHYRKKKSTQKPCTDDMDADRHIRSKKSRQRHSYLSDDSDQDRKSKDKHSYSPEDSDHSRHEHKKKTMQKLYISENSDTVRRNSRTEKRRLKHPYSSEDDAERHLKGQESRHKHSSSRRHKDSNSDAERRSRHRHHH